MRLVFVTQSVDAEDPILGATVAKLRALAQRCDELVVITDHVGAHDLPPNCTLRTFGSRTKLGRGLRYMQVLVPQLLRRDRPDAVIAHMCPIYLVLAAPVAKVVRVPLALWYTHWTIDRTLKLATRLADVGLSVDRRSYPIADPKVLGIGHGIDVSQFGAREGAPAGNGTLRLLALGRTSPSKAFPTLVRACALARAQGVDLQVAIHGASSTDEERRHRGELEALVESEGLAGTVELGEPVPRPAVPDLVRRFDAVVNTTRGQTSGGRARQGRLRVGSVRRARLRVQSLLRRVSQRSPRRAPLRERRRRRSGARPPFVRGERREQQGHRRPRAAPPRRDRPLRRQLGGRGRRDGAPAPRLTDAAAPPQRGPDLRRLRRDARVRSGRHADHSRRARHRAVRHLGADRLDPRLHRPARLRDRTVRDPLCRGAAGTRRPRRDE